MALAAPPLPQRGQRPMRLPLRLLAGLGVVGAILTATAVPGPVVIDENHYLSSLVALRAGRLTVPGTETMPPSKELLWFDPAGSSRIVDRVPVAPTVPPLWAPIAWPFAPFGWRGFVLLNVLALLATVGLVFRYAAAHASSAHTPWVASLILLAGGYCLEYAQGLWPHMLTMGLCFGAFVLASRAREGRAGPAVLGGLLAGLAAGIRYQNALFGMALGATLVLWSQRRMVTTASYGFGLAVPLLACSVMNRVRLGWWHPFSKGPRYLAPAVGSDLAETVSTAVHMAWARIVDFSARPPLTGSSHAEYLAPDPITGCYVVVGALKKAWLQSAPWMVVGLVVLALAWWPRSASGGAADRIRELRAASVPVAAMLGAFAVAGRYRTDGAAFNQRYFLELVPLVAVAAAWALDRFEVERRPLLLGTVGGIGLALPGLVLPGGAPLGQLLLSNLPLALAIGFLGAWLAAVRGGRGTVWVAVGLGTTLGWSLAVHLGDDLPASRALRTTHLRVARAVAPFVDGPTLVVAYRGSTVPFGALLLDRDLLVVDPGLDEGGDLLEIVARAGDRRRLLWQLGLRPELEAELETRYELRAIEGAPRGLRELVPRPSSRSPECPKTLSG